MRRRPILEAVLLAGLSLGFPLPCAVHALPVHVDKVAFVPAHFLVGEEVEAWVLVSMDVAEPKPFDIKAGAGLPAVSAQADPEIRALSLSRGAGGWEFRYRFVAWSPGHGLIPAIEAKGFSIPAIAYSTSSVLGNDERELSPPKPQLDPPGTALYLYGFAAFVILLGLLVFAMVAWLLPASRRLLERRKATEARRALGKTLSWLGKGIPESAPGDFYAVLSHALRHYLAARVLPEAPALTPTELGSIPDERFPLPGLRDEAAGLLLESDAVRYAGEAADAGRMRAALARANRIGDRAEEALDARL